MVGDIATMEGPQVWLNARTTIGDVPGSRFERGGDYAVIFRAVSLTSIDTHPDDSRRKIHPVQPPFMMVCTPQG